MKKDTSRAERSLEKQPSLFDSEKHVDALRELSGHSPPPLEVPDRRQRIQQALDAVHGTKRSADGVMFPRRVAAAAGVEQPTFTPLVRRLARLTYRQLRVARHQFQAKSRAEFVTEAAAVRKQSTEELEQIIEQLQSCLSDLVAGEVLIKQSNGQDSTNDPQQRIRDIVVKMAFAVDKDVFSRPHELEDPLRHEPLTALLKTRPYREIEEKLQEFFWGAVVNMALQFDEACQRAVDHHIFGLANYDQEAKTAQFHFFEQHQEQYSWSCQRHDHELINAARRRVDEAEAEGIDVPGFVKAVVARTPWIAPLLSIVDGELIQQESVQVRHPTEPLPPPAAPQPPAVRTPPTARPDQGRPRRKHVRNFTVSYDPALLLGPYATLGWEAGNLREGDRMMQAPPSRSPLIATLRTGVQEALRVLRWAASIAAVLALLVLICLSVGPSSALQWPLDSKGGALWLFVGMFASQRLLAALHDKVSRSAGGEA